jgi:hypothetical protein
MLDVHPPHAAAHTWKDFFIHIATIVVGLIIAVGLEQGVELLHHRHEVTETREALRLEREENARRYQTYAQQYVDETAELEADMSLLRSVVQHHNPPGPVPKPVYVPWYHLHRNQFAHAAWDTAQQSGVLNLMPQDEVLRDQNLSLALSDISRTNEDEWLAFNEATRYMFNDPDLTTLSPDRLSEEMTLLEKLMMKHYLRGNFMGYPPEQAGFPAIIPQDGLSTFHHARPCTPQSCMEGVPLASPQR